MSGKLPVVSADPLLYSAQTGCRDAHQVGIMGEAFKIIRFCLLQHADQSEKSVEQTAQIFDILLGDNLQGRKDYIVEHGNEYIDNLDVS